MENSVNQTQNGVIGGEDSFDSDLKEIMEAAPDLSDSSSTVQSGSPQKSTQSGMSQSAYVGSTSTSAKQAAVQPRMSRSYTVPATSNIPLSGSQSSGGDFVPKTITGNSKMENIKAWGINTYKCTKQYVTERLGKTSKTIDLELEAQIEVLRDTQKKYANILRLSRLLTNHFSHVVQTQRALGEAFSELSQKSSSLTEEFASNSESQRSLVRNGEILISALNFFTSSINTLIYRTMDDTLLTIKRYEAARLEFDAYRNDVDSLQSVPPRDSTAVGKTEEARKKFEDHKMKYERLRGDVSIKLKFLEENKVKVMHKQLVLFHNAIAAYFSGNATGLEATVKQFNIKLQQPNSANPSWIEQ